MSLTFVAWTLGALGIDWATGPVTEAIDSGLEKVFNKRASEVLEEAQAKLRAYGGKPPSNHSLERGLRLLELTSSLLVLKSYWNWDTDHRFDDRASRPPPFIAAARNWLHQQIGLCASLTLRDDPTVVKELEAALDEMLRSGAPVDAARSRLRKAELAVWDALVAGARTGEPPEAPREPPEAFRERFFGEAGWAAAFRLFVQDALKKKPKMRETYYVSRIAALCDESAALRPALDALAGDTQRMRTILDSLLDRDPGPIVPDRDEAELSLKVIGPRGRPTFAPIRFPHPTGLYAATFSPSGRSIVVALKMGTERKSSGQVDNIGGRAFIWNANGPKPSDRKAERASHEKGVVYAVFSPDGSRIATASEDASAKVWYARDKGVAVSRPLHHDETINTVHFTPDGLRIVTASWDGTAVIWDAYTGDLELKLNHRSGPDDDDVVNSAFFSPRGDEVLTATYNGTVRIWNASTGEVVRSFPILDRHRALCCASYSPDGKLIVTSDAENGTSCVWNAADGSFISVLGGKKRHKAAVWSAAFSHSGDKVVTASADFTALVWDVAAAEVIARMDHPAPVITAYFSPDDSRILTACDDGYAYLWQVA